MIDLGRAIGYPFAGQNSFVKSLIGSLLFLMVVPSFFLAGLVLLGYQLRIVRVVLAGRDDELPEWNNFPQDLGAGVVVVLGTLLYYVPVVILVGAGATLIVDLLEGVSAADLLLYRDRLDFEREKALMVLLTFALALLWMVLSAPLVMASVALYAETGEFSAFVNILDRADEVWEQRGAAGRLMWNLFLLTVIAQAVNIALSSFACLCVLGAYVQFVQFAATCHLTGQYGKVLRDHRPPPNVIRPLKPRR